MPTLNKVSCILYLVSCDILGDREKGKNKQTMMCSVTFIKLFIAKTFAKL